MEILENVLVLKLKKRNYKKIKTEANPQIGPRICKNCGCRISRINFPNYNYWQHGNNKTVKNFDLKATCDQHGCNKPEVEG